jgi:3-oxoacyl-[acyl-carrier-protein] synthase II
MARVVITGLGPVSSIGIGVAALEESLRAGRSGAAEIRSFDTAGFPYSRGCEVSGFDSGRLLEHLEPGKWGRSSQFAAAAARLALIDAGLDIPVPSADRVSAVMGTTSGESQVIEQLTASLVAGGFDALDPSVARMVPAERLAYAVAAETGLRGEALTIATACSASNYAIGHALDLIAEGEADVVVAGGADSVCRWAHAGFYRLGALAPSQCAPFDEQRRGILTGEGGVAVVLETADHAEARGARVYAELLGYGMNCDAKHPVAPDAASIAACMRTAHHNAGVKPGDIDWICAHGTGTTANDTVEVAAIRQVFGDRLPPVTSIKSMLGHTMGAASGFGVVASALGIYRGFLPPTINMVTLDPGLSDLDVVPNAARAAPVRIVQNDGFAFGGNNAIVILGRRECGESA